MIFQRCALLDVKGDVVDLNVCAQYVVCVYMHCVCVCVCVCARECWCIGVGGGSVCVCRHTSNSKS